MSFLYYYLCGGYINLIDKKVYMMYFLLLAKKYRHAVFVHADVYCRLFHKDDSSVFVPVIIHYKDVIYSFY